MNKYSYQGGCHCHQVRYKFTLEQSVESTEVLSCNCSMCEKTGFLHLIIAKTDFKLNTDLDNLNNYQFNKKIAKHYFCNTCGIKSFYQPRSHPDSWSINVRCIDDFANLKLSVKNFDGKNWESNINNIT